MRKVQIQALWIYYKGISPFTLIVSAGLLYTFFQFKEGKSLFVFSKTVTLILTAIMLKFFYKTDAFPFYENLGVRQNILILLALLFDWFLFILCLQLTLLL